MWRKACPWSTGVLAVALILTAWRLKAVETELDRMRDEIARVRMAVPATGPTASPGAPDGASAAVPTEARAPSGDGSDMSREWEQAVPPMDS